MAMITMQQLLKTMVDKGASDLHITSGSPPQLRIGGLLTPLAVPRLTPDDTKRLCYSILTPSQIKRFERDRELDFSFGVKGLSRFRANIFIQRGAISGAFRAIPFQIKTLQELGVPPIVGELAFRPRGLVLITGPTGSGKTTTISALIDLINSNRQGHIITIEDPIEFLHQHKKCIVSQREVGMDTHSFKNALKYVLRQDPDVILIGEMRDLDTIETALTLAETGHLVLATLHTNTAIQSINRIIDVFPPHQQSQVRAQLSFVLEGVVSQQLVRTKTGKLALACEILVMTPAIRNLIRENKIQQIYSQMQVGQEKSRMQTMNQALVQLVERGVISIETALSRCTDIDEFQNLIKNLQL